MILVTMRLEQEQKIRLENIAAPEQIKFVDRETLNGADLAEAEIIIGNIPIQRLGECKKLRWIQLNNAGADDFAKSKELRKETFLTNASGAYGLVIAEHMLGMLLVLQKHLNIYHRQQLHQEWRSEGSPVVLEGKKVLILGTGDIGMTFAKKVQALGCYTIGVKRTTIKELSGFDEIYTMDDLDKVLPRADVLAMALPQTEETRKLMDEERLGMMKESAYVLNVGRGSALDTDALVKALKAGKLAGAALDVTEPEPLPKGHPLWDMENVILTPHIAGNYDVPETLERILDIAEDNLYRFLHGIPLRNIVNRDMGY